MKAEEKCAEQRFWSLEIRRPVDVTQVCISAGIALSELNLRLLSEFPCFFKAEGEHWSSDQLLVRMRR